MDGLNLQVTFVALARRSSFSSFEQGINTSFPQTACQIYPDVEFTNVHKQQCSHKVSQCSPYFICWYHEIRNLCPGDPWGPPKLIGAPGRHDRHGGAQVQMELRRWIVRFGGPVGFHVTIRGTAGWPWQWHGLQLRTTWTWEAP